LLESGTVLKAGFCLVGFVNNSHIAWQMLARNPDLSVCTARFSLSKNSASGLEQQSTSHLH